jgi:hypothetical protein
MPKSNYPKFRLLIFPLALLIVVCFMFAAPAADFLHNKKADTAIAVKDSAITETNTVNQFSFLYTQMNLDSFGLSQEAFNYGLQGYTDMISNGEVKKSNLLSIVDFSLPSSKKRLYICFAWP